MAVGKEVYTSLDDSQSIALYNTAYYNNIVPPRRTVVVPPVVFSRSRRVISFVARRTERGTRNGGGGPVVSRFFRHRDEYNIARAHDTARVLFPTHVVVPSVSHTRIL